jgi:hypothetical protein
MRQCAFLGEEYGESKYSTESHWFARGFRHGSDADSDLETSRDRKLTERCEICRRAVSIQSRELLRKPPARFDSFFVPVPSQNSIRAENGTILPPYSVKNLNSTMSVYEERKILSVSACARGVHIKGG